MVPGGVARGDDGDVEQRQQFQSKLVFPDDPDHAERRPPQRVGIAGPGRPFVDREEARQLVQLVRQRHRDGDRRGRHRIGRAARRVMVADRIGDVGVLMVVQRVVTTHDALQFRKLADHAGDEVGLGQFGRPVGQCLAGIDQGRDPLGQTAQPVHPLPLGAEFGVVGDVIQRRHPAFQRRLAVQVPEMAGVGEPGAQHAFVTGDDGGAAILGLDIGGEDEPGRGRRRWRRAGGEIALVDPHRDLHDLGRQVHVLVGDAAGQRTGHSTSPATSSSRPGSSTTVTRFSAAMRAMPSAMTRLRSAVSART